LVNDPLGGFTLKSVVLKVVPTIQRGKYLST